MPRFRHSLLSIPLILVITLTGCNLKAVSQADYGRLQQQCDSLLLENSQLRGQIDEVDAKVAGAFVATVRQLIPDYCSDTWTLNTAVVTLFQSGPFVIRVGEDIASTLQVNRTYYFEVKEAPIGKISQALLSKRTLGPEVMVEMYHLTIASARLAKDDEIGLSEKPIEVIFQKL